MKIQGVQPSSKFLISYLPWQGHEVAAQMAMGEIAYGGAGRKRKGLDSKGMEVLAETSFQLRQFTEVLQLRSSEWASLQKF